MPNLESDPASGGGLYVHVAYCRRKCIYCDFFSAGDRIADWPRYVDALCAEFNDRIHELACPFRTVYFGGGTPSLMPEAEFRRLCAFLKPHMAQVEEFTLEVNPDDVCEQMLALWKECGVNRLSIGIQTFDDACLKAIGRRHDSKTAINAFMMARKMFDNISIDLMFGLPGQSIDMWREDLRIALELNSEHISAYSLMYEEGTALTALRDSGRIDETPEETAEKMFSILIEEMQGAGYEHYEISNFARPGYRSRHNSSYWLQKPYLGLGPSAHSYDGINVRKGNRADLKGYLEYWAPLDECGNHTSTTYETELLSIEELMEEYVLTRMRMKEGIPIGDFKERFGEKACDRLKERGLKLSERGLVKIADDHISILESAVLLADSIIVDLADL